MSEFLRIVGFARVFDGLLSEMKGVCDFAARRAARYKYALHTADAEREAERMVVTGEMTRNEADVWLRRQQRIDFRLVFVISENLQGAPFHLG